MRTLVPVAALLAVLALAVPAVGGSMPLVLASFQHDATFGPTPELPMRHHVFYTFDVENPGAALSGVYLRVQGFPVPGAPFSGTTTFRVGDVPAGATTFSFEASNLPYTHVCASLVATSSTGAPDLSNVVCEDVNSLQGVVLP
jgi:hypothetical protein